jgi:hypothetical protein
VEARTDKLRAEAAVAAESSPGADRRLPHTAEPPEASAARVLLATMKSSETGRPLQL